MSFSGKLTYKTLKVPTKIIKNYAKIYKKALSQVKVENIDAEIDSYKKRLGEMYATENFKKYRYTQKTGGLNDGLAGA